MKKILLFATLATLLFSFRFMSDTQGIVNALKAGSSSQFTGYFDNTVDIKLPEKDELKNVGHNQAGNTLSAFFSDIDVKGFDKTSEGERSGTMYLTGKLQGKDKTYSVTLLMKSRGDKPIIITVRIN
ncbi:MAG: hypothetical protein JWN76_145 [Chitinophagaceae bacterium]|nr:hypothetical protein [Chitinophagaceae bacterium]